MNPSTRNTAAMSSAQRVASAKPAVSASTAAPACSPSGPSSPCVRSCGIVVPAESRVAVASESTAGPVRPASSRAAGSVAARAVEMMAPATAVPSAEPARGVRAQEQGEHHHAGHLQTQPDQHGARGAEPGRQVTGRGAREERARGHRGQDQARPHHIQAERVDEVERQHEDNGELADGERADGRRAHGLDGPGPDEHAPARGGCRERGRPAADSVAQRRRDDTAGHQPFDGLLLRCRA